MAKILLSYKYLTSGWPGDSHYKWSFTIFSRGTVWLRKENHVGESAYKFRIPHKAADRIHAYLAKNKEIIEALPKVCGGGCDGYAEWFSFLGKEILGIMITYNTRSLSALKLAKESSLPGAVNEREGKNEDEGEDAWSVENTVLELFTKACKVLQAYGLSSALKSEDRRRQFRQYKSFYCAWNIPDRFYSSDERFPIWEYESYPASSSDNNDCGLHERFSAALYYHGTLQLKTAESVYQLKIEQSTADAIRNALDSRGLIKKYHKQNWRYSLLNIDVFILSNKTGLNDEDAEIIYSAFRLLEPYSFEVKRTYKRSQPQSVQDGNRRRLIDKNITDELYPYEPDTRTNSIVCLWTMPECKQKAVLLKAHNYRYSFSVYEDGLVYLTDECGEILSDGVSGMENGRVECYFYLPKQALSRLCARIIQYQDIINSTADSKPGEKDDTFSLGGADTAFSLSGGCDQAAQAFFAICQALKPYGFSITSYPSQKADSRIRIIFNWLIRNIPNYLFRRPK